MALWLATRYVSLDFWQTKSPLDYSENDDTYTWFIIMTELPLFFLIESLFCIVVNAWTEYKLTYINFEEEAGGASMESGINRKYVNRRAKIEKMRKWVLIIGISLVAVVTILVTSLKIFQKDPP